MRKLVNIISSNTSPFNTKFECPLSTGIIILPALLIMSTSDSGVHIFNPKDNPSLAATYSQISVVPISETKRLISFAGQTGTSHGKADNEKLSFADQVRLALEKVDKNLAAVGASKKDIVMIRP